MAAVAAMYLARRIVRQGRLGFGAEEVARLSLGLNGMQRMCMFVAFDEEPLVGTRRPGGVTRAGKDLPVWLPSATSQPALAPIVPSLHGRSQGTWTVFAPAPPRFLLE